MGSNGESSPRLTKSLRYLARIISSLMAAFILFFAVGEGILAMQRGEGAAWNAEGIRMTIYFVAIAIGAVLAWWRDRVGGVILTLVGIIFIGTVFITMERHDYWITLIFGVPFLVSGLLLLLCWRRSKPV